MLCSKLFLFNPLVSYTAPQGAPTGVSGLITREVGEKTELYKQNVGGVVSKGGFNMEN